MSRKGGWILLLIVGALIIVSGGLLIFHKSAKAAPVATPIMPRDKNPYNFRAADSAVHLLKSGQLALRTGADATSYMLRMMNLTDKTYSHCGIVMIEDGYPFIYHCIGGEDNPDARLRRDSAVTFFSPVANERLGIVQLDLKEAQVAALHSLTKAYYKKAPCFDMDFDLATDDKLYCAEFVYKAIREASADTAYFATTRFLKLHYVGVDNLYRTPHAHIICDVRFK